ncbi:MAG: hypothetical protein ABSC46_13040 [Candidatus Limnocylindrales bacterium]|jgi:hypothetical protein
MSTAGAGTTITAWVTDLAGNFLADLDRSEAKAFRHFAFRRELGVQGVGGSAAVGGGAPGTGGGSLEYRRFLPDGTLNPVLAAHPNIFNPDDTASSPCLIWFSFRGVITIWIVETSKDVLDSTEESGAWTAITGRGAKQLLADRQVWPTAFTGTQTDPSKWAGQYYAVNGADPGPMLWAMVAASNARFPMQIVQGTVQTSANTWTQNFRFDKILDVCTAVEAAYGDVVVDGIQTGPTTYALRFNYYTNLGFDRTASVLFEEGADLLTLTHDVVVTDKTSWLVAESTGSGVFAKLAIAGGSGLGRRRENYAGAKGTSDPTQLQVVANAALAAAGTQDAIAFDTRETTYQALQDFDVGDLVSVRALDRNINKASVQVVALTFADDDNLEIVTVAIEVGSFPPYMLGMLRTANQATASSLGTLTMQPQGQLVPINFSDSGVFDSGNAFVTGIYVPSRVLTTIECKVGIDFDQFWGPETGAASGGSGTSGNGTSHHHALHNRTGAAGGFALNGFDDGQNNGTNVVDIYSQQATLWSYNESAPHTHTTPAHTHGITYGIYKEGYPASHSVNLSVYKLVGSTWTLQGSTITGLTADSIEQDLSAYVTGPGKWRLVFQSAAGQPNGGRLGVHLSGYLLGAIQSV